MYFVEDGDKLRVCHVSRTGVHVRDKDVRTDACYIDNHCLPVYRDNSQWLTYIYKGSLNKTHYRHTYCVQIYVLYSQIILGEASCTADAMPFVCIVESSKNMRGTPNMPKQLLSTVETGKNLQKRIGSTMYPEGVVQWPSASKNELYALLE